MVSSLNVEAVSNSIRGLSTNPESYFYFVSSVGQALKRLTPYLFSHTFGIGVLIYRYNGATKEICEIQSITGLRKTTYISIFEYEIDGTHTVPIW